MKKLMIAFFMVALVLTSCKAQVKDVPINVVSQMLAKKFTKPFPLVPEVADWPFIDSQKLDATFTKRPRDGAMLLAITGRAGNLAASLDEVAAGKSQYKWPEENYVFTDHKFTMNGKEILKTIYIGENVECEVYWAAISGGEYFMINLKNMNGKEVVEERKFIQ